MGIDDIQIAGDSLVTVEWFKGNYHLDAVLLDTWKERILLLKGQFVDISIQHIYRENNCDADILSKKDLALPMGKFMVARGEGRDLSTYHLFGTF